MALDLLELAKSAPDAPVEVHVGDELRFEGLSEDWWAEWWAPDLDEWGNAHVDQLVWHFRNHAIEVELVPGGLTLREEAEGIGTTYTIERLRLRIVKLYGRDDAIPVPPPGGEPVGGGLPTPSKGLVVLAGVLALGIGFTADRAYRSVHLFARSSELSGAVEDLGTAGKLVAVALVLGAALYLIREVRPR